MSLINTKPKWFNGEIVATERGWVNPKNNEVLVAIGNLRIKLEAEYKKALPITTVTPDDVVAETSPEIKPEIKETLKMEQKVKLTKSKTQKSVLGENTEKKIPVGQQLIGEIVEYDVDKIKVIAE